MSCFCKETHMINGTHAVRESIIQNEQVQYKYDDVAIRWVRSEAEYKS